MYSKNGVAVADYTVHIIFCPLEHVPDIVHLLFLWIKTELYRVMNLKML